MKNELIEDESIELRNEFNFKFWHLSFNTQVAYRISDKKILSCLSIQYLLKSTHFVFTYNFIQ